MSENIDSGEESLRRARQYAGACAGTISFGLWTTCVIAAYAVQVLGTKDNGYGYVHQSDGSKGVERWLLWASAAWFALGWVFLWSGATRNRSARWAPEWLFAVAFFVGIGVFAALYS